MLALLRSCVVATVLLVSLQHTRHQEDTQSPASDSGLAAANQLYRAGKFADAEASYQAVLKNDSKLVPAQVGLVRAMLGQQKLDEALTVVNTALVVQPNSAALLAAKGDVQFRRGEMSDAEMSYLAAEKQDPKEVRAHLGLARLYVSSSLYRNAYNQLQIAHTIAPDDFEVQAAWMATLPPKQQLAAMDSYLASLHPDQEEEKKSATARFEFLKTIADQPNHACRLVSKVDHTETKLRSVNTGSGNKRGVGLATKINDRNVLLLVDTGASGIVVDRHFAKKARLTRISAAYRRGIRDHGPQSGYRAVADNIRVGDLEFNDCVVVVTDKPGAEGLIGTDVFASYLVDLDFREMQLKLTPLPKRPEDVVAPTSLNCETEVPGSVEQQVPSPQSPQPLHRNRYAAPEMVNWTRVFRFEHMLLVPTRVNESKPMLFTIDTGSHFNVLSVRAGQQASKVHFREQLLLSPSMGYVNKVFSSSKATLRFAHLVQENRDVITVDLADMNRQIGTEVSGFLGFEVLTQLELKLDYRDGLVDFEYNPKRRR